MPLRRFIGRFMICIAVVLASSYVQAMAHVDAVEQENAVEVAEAKLPPCHQAMKDQSGQSKTGHHDGCCSNFACAVGLLVDDSLNVPQRVVVTYDMGVVGILISEVRQPPYPPPKTV